ncbi:hypothetical protein DID88_003189 [Monilinia fructigena]|uniref:Major facilitator superfamily (MFS) profile domain-containing protein n=1 Tax=Monilinia fructigena TaxID=38457 RepID=A0A395IV27_9HELO|nr:hypothetical protein DID88_003189 [Monilinia fructigena]
MQAVENNYAEETCLKNRDVTVADSKDCIQNENLEKSGVDSHFPDSENLDDNSRTPTTSKENLEGGVVQNAPNSSSDEAFDKEDDNDDFPEGGLKGWSVVVGSFCGSFSVFGILNSSGILLEYFSTHQLKDYDTSQIGWIFGLSLFLTFFCGAPIGPIFDAYGPRVLIFSGSILTLALLCGI